MPDIGGTDVRGRRGATTLHRLLGMLPSSSTQ
jgi:hypothetical protein